jgi:hypothetical protein
MNTFKEYWTSYRFLLLAYPILILVFSVLYWFVAYFSESDETILDQPLQAIYFSVVTFTTLGYGDISPQGFNKFLATLEATVGIVFIGLMINRVFHVAMEKSTSRKLEPIRKGIAIKLLKACRSLFNDVYHMVECENKTDLSAHGFPPGFTQEQANYWTKSVFKKQLDREREELEKLVTMNASHLGDELAPLTFDLVTSTEKLASTAHFLVEAFHPENKGVRSTFDPKEYIIKAQAAYDSIIGIFPSIENEVIEYVPNAPDGDQLIEAFRKSDDSTPSFSLLKKRVD